MKSQEAAMPTGQEAPSKPESQSFEALLEGWNCKYLGMRTVAGADEEGAHVQGLLRLEGVERDSDSPEVAQWVHQLTTESQDLTRRIRSLETELKQLRRARQDAQERERARAIAAVKQMMSMLGIADAQLAQSDRPLLALGVGSEPRTCAASPPFHYRGPKGEVWMGRGRHPKWLKDLLQAGACITDYGCIEPIEERAPSAHRP